MFVERPEGVGRMPDPGSSCRVRTPVRAHVRYLQCKPSPSDLRPPTFFFFFKPFFFSCGLVSDQKEREGGGAENLEGVRERQVERWSAAWLV